MLQKLKEFLIVEVASLVHFLMSCTWRIKRGPLPPDIAKRIHAGQPVIFGHLHQDDVTLLALFQKQKVGVLVSYSKDGNLLSKYFQKIGYVVARGSSSRGAASGFLELLRLCKDEKLSWITFAVDGPRGPVGKTKHGIFKLAELLDAPVVPVVAVASKRITLKKSWSKTFIPLPFCRVESKFLEPIPAHLVKEQANSKNYSLLSKIFEERIRSEKSGYY